MHTIGIAYQFEAGHYLTGLPDTHKCSRPHGHNYEVIVEFKSATLNDVGFVIDYFDARPIKDFIDAEWDHRMLNDVVEFNTTVENLAEFLFTKFKPQFPQLSSITFKETPTSVARYEDTK